MKRVSHRTQGKTQHPPIFPRHRLTVGKLCLPLTPPSSPAVSRYQTPGQPKDQADVQRVPSTHAGRSFTG